MLIHYCVHSPQNGAGNKAGAHKGFPGRMRALATCRGSA